jgi:hypothetical protein
MRQIIGTCGHPVSKPGVAECRDCWVNRGSSKPAPETLAADRDRLRSADTIASLKARYAEALKTIERQERQIGAAAALGRPVDTFKIEPRAKSGTSEATPVLVASDWHIEEKVGAEVGGLNRYSLEIAKERSTRFFQSGLRLIRLLSQDVTISTAVLALLGDFITNVIHDAENAEMNEVHPTEAILVAQGFIVSGIEFLLNHSKLSLVVPCHSGNHARTTKTTRFSAENGHSLEYLMFRHLAAYFRHEPRVTFIIPEGMHSYLGVYDQTIRFQHGHSIKYGGGVGGIFIPAYKAIAQWNKGKRADLDVFGHFHQSKDGGNFLCNGSLIGYNGFALAIKADFEPPRQTLFLMDKRRGRTCTWPIIVGDDGSAKRRAA